MLNFNLDKINPLRKLQLNELEEIWLDAYENSKVYKERMKVIIIYKLLISLLRK